MKGKSKEVIAVAFLAVMVMMAFVGIVSAVTIGNHTMCKDTESRIATNSTGYAPLPIDETTEFYLTDSEAICLVQIERINRGDTFRFEWYNPRDLLYQLNNSTTDPYFECWYTIYSNVTKAYTDAQGYILLNVGFVNISPPILGFGTCWLSSSLKIDGYPPANMIGNWHVDFYYNDEKQFTETFTISEPIPSLIYVLDTGPSKNPYPSIFGTHNGMIKLNQTIEVCKIYTYPCSGTGGHTKYAKIYNNSWSIETLPWNGYKEDWHNRSFSESFKLYANVEYNYTIRTGSYPQIIHAKSKDVTGGTITCTSFVDANGEAYTDRIPAIRLE